MAIHNGETSFSDDCYAIQPIAASYNESHVQCPLGLHDSIVNHRISLLELRIVND